MDTGWKVAVVLVCGIAAACAAADGPDIRAKWQMPPRCEPFAPPRIKDLKDELRRTGYRLVIAIHPKTAEAAEGKYPARDLFLINADGTGLKRLTDTPDKEERTPRTAPDGKSFSSTSRR